ncbi:MAG: metallophosphoesterase [Chlamydiota bacterium]
MLASSFSFAHLSDLHFFHMSWGLGQFFSKRWIGNGNFILRRKREFNYKLLEGLSSILVEEKVPFALISGDVSCTSSEKEFAKAKTFIESLQNHGIETLTLPGNHDKYTKDSTKKNFFYNSFPSSLSTEGFKVQQLNPSWWMIALDTTLPTPLFCCHGHFSSELEEKLDIALKNLPSHANVILTNHFPMVDKKENALKRSDALASLCKRHKKVRLYLHGHTHKPKIYDGRSLDLPIIVDAGSAVHQFSGGWNLIQCEDTGCTISPFTWTQGKWTPAPPTSFTWTN